MARKCVTRVEIRDGCPHFENQYFTYLEQCRKLGTKIPKDSEFQHPIPDDCPLPNFSDDWDDET